MASCNSIPKGPQSFERLLARAKLSKREEQAVRSVVLSMTASEAAPIIGVSSSTVGSYRQRAYTKLGVRGRVDFLRLPEVAAWADSINIDCGNSHLMQTSEMPDEDHSAKIPQVVQSEIGLDEESRSSSEGHAAEEAPISVSGSGQVLKKASLRERAGRKSLMPVVVFCCVLLTFILFLIIYSNASPKEYAEQPHGVIASSYGEVPNVVGMRADAAATEIANAGFCPEFRACASSLSAGTVLSIEQVGSTDELRHGISSFSWGSGCTACYEEDGQWLGYVVLAVSV